MSCWPEIHPSQVLAGLFSASAREYADLWAPVLQPTSERSAALAEVPDDQATGDTRFRPRLRLDSYGHYPKHARAIRTWREQRSTSASRMMVSTD